MSKIKQGFSMLASIGPECHPVVGPESVMVDFCDTCNMHCLCCFNYSPLGPCPFNKDQRKRSFPKEMFIRLLDACESLGVATINLAGYGEPLMHPDSAELIEEIRKHHLKAAITTNGSLLTQYPEIVNILSSAFVSVHAGSSEVYTRMHPVDSPGNWQRVLDGFNLLHSKSIPITIGYVLCSENYQDIGNAIELAAEYGADIAIQPIQPFIRKEEGVLEFDPAKKDTLQLTEQHLDELLSMQEGLNRLASAKGVSLYGLDDYLFLAVDRRRGDPDDYVNDTMGSLYDRQPCYIGWFFSRVLMDGSVTPCCQCVGGITLGNINNKSFSEIWRSPEYQWFRTAALHVPLRETDIWQNCQCTICGTVTKNRKIYKRLAGGGFSETIFRLARLFFQHKSKSESKKPLLANRPKE